MEQLISRVDQLAQVRAALKKKFPKATFSTNDDANPATPISVRVEWGNGKVIKTVRADSPTSTVEQFLSKAIRVLEPFERDNVPARHLT
jgi:hypothetical protein